MACATLFNDDTTVDSHLTCLNIGAPGEDTLQTCAQLLQQASAKTLAKSGDIPDRLQYGPVCGPPDFLNTLAAFLTDEYQRPVQSDHLFVTGGATQGLAFALSVLFDRNKIVFVEEPTYCYALSVMRDCNAQIISVPMDSKGMISTSLDSQLKDCLDKCQTVTAPFSCMVYLIPTYHNPTGISYTLDRCQELIKVAQRYNALIFCDDIYNLLYFDDRPPPFHFMDLNQKLIDEGKTASGYVLSNGSFSKIFCPGIRLGWIETSRPILDILSNSGLVLSGGGINNYMAHIMNDIIEMDLLTDLLKQLRIKYKRRVDVIIKVLEEHLPKKCFYQIPKGGYFLWLCLPVDISASAVLDVALLKYQVKAMYGKRCSVNGYFKHCIRISFSKYNEEALTSAVGGLCFAIADVVNAPPLHKDLQE